MSFIKLAIPIFLFLIVLPLFSKSFAQTELTVSMTVGDTSLVLQGRTSPQAHVVFLENGQVIGTTDADLEGNFSKTFSAQEPGLKAIGIYSIDSTGKTTSTITQSISLIPFTQTTLSNIILPPTLAIANTTLTYGEMINASGMAVPYSIITLFIEGSQNEAITTSTSELGYWARSYDTLLIPAGYYQLFVKAVTPIGHNSERSQTFDLAVNLPVTPSPTPDPTTEPTKTATKDLTDLGSEATSPDSDGLELEATLAPTTIPTPTQIPLPDYLSIYDINKDGVLDEKDLYEAMRLWVSLKRDSSEVTTCDLNNDGRCDIVDFSILLSWFRLNGN